LFGGCGTFFEIAPGHAPTTLYTFCQLANCADGWRPSAVPPVLGMNGSLYSTTNFGGNTETNNCGVGCGTMFAITPAGAFTTVHTFCETEACGDGVEPNGVVLLPDGNFLGATKWAAGGLLGGSIYEITPAGKLSVLHMYDGEVGAGFAEPTQPIQGSDGNLYGTIPSGGNGGVFYTMTPEGKMTVLYRFCSEPNCADGAGPNRVIQGTDGNFYGTTTGGGTSTNPTCATESCGTLFQITPTGKLTTLHSFCSEKNCADGSFPMGALIQATNGMFYGSVQGGGPSSNCAGAGCGTIFSLSMGLSPFVEANPNFGSAGQVVVILGNNLTGTSSVMFNGTPAKFTVVSGTYIRATVPSGATSGAIEVTTADGTLSSSVAFQVKP
jgi:uncharacterized repeat protein (TIGR03803 family)